MPYGLPEVQQQNIPEKYARGRAQGAEMERIPIMKQLDELKVKGQEQALQRGQKQMTLQDYAAQDEEKKFQRELMIEAGIASSWVLEAQDPQEQAMRLESAKENFSNFMPADELEQITLEDLPMLADYGRKAAGGGKAASKRGFAPIPMQREGETYLVGPSFDPRTGEFTTQDIPIEGQLASKLGETPEQLQAREIATAKGKVGAKIEAEVEAVDVIADAQAKIVAAKERAKIVSKGMGEAEERAASLEASMPALREVVGSLSELANIATYTKAGRVYDAAVRELGFKVPKGATARAKYKATVDTEVLPLLKQTFGAAFTVPEGDSLRATLGDPDLSPIEKHAQLEAFIEQKERQILTERRRTGKETKTLSIDDLVNKYAQ